MNIGPTLDKGQLLYKYYNCCTGPHNKKQRAYDTSSYAPIEVSWRQGQPSPSLNCSFRDIIFFGGSSFYSSGNYLKIFINIPRIYDVGESYQFSEILCYTHTSILLLLYSMTNWQLVSTCICIDVDGNECWYLDQFLHILAHHCHPYSLSLHHTSSSSWCTFSVLRE